MRSKLSALKHRTISRSRRLLNFDQALTKRSLSLGPAWFHQINTVNRRLLRHPFVNSLQNGRAKNGGTRLKLEYTWKIALSTLAGEWAHRTYKEAEDLAALESLFAYNIDQQGDWLTPIDRVAYAMKGYSLLYLAQVTAEKRYCRAVNQLAEKLLSSHPRAADGSLPYDTNTEAILVDSLAMICPFLARYGQQYRHTEAMEVSANQLEQFVARCVDPDTKLPYHGYFAGGPTRLGLQGWGRGTGWYMLGLIDTLSEMSQAQAGYAELLQAYVSAANSVRTFQREDGHWSWVILHRKDTPDSSTTSLIGYSILRGMQLGILDRSFRDVIATALQALVGQTRPDGIVDGSLAECRGLGKYPQQYEPTLWLQGATTALAALYFGEKNTESNVL
jgi:rhamnogalacturonyl hydrolase YesR